MPTKGLYARPGRRGPRRPRRPRHAWRVAALALVRRCYRTGRVWWGAPLGNPRYSDMAAEVLAL